MAKIYQELKLDVLKANNAIKIQAKQNDVDSRYLKVTVTEDGKPIDMSGFTSVQINVKRDNGENEAFAGEIAKGVVIVPIPSWALEVAGYASCDISMLNGEGEILTTLSFRLYVEKSNYKRDITPNDPNYTAFEKALIDIESLKSGGGSSGGGFKKIGFTEDCDYVATAEEGLTAFRSAVEAASDGDTILVMQGVYKGLNQFDVVKDINFIGVGMPKIEFPVWISGGGVFNFESWSWETLYPNVKSCWCGFSFLNSFMVGHECNPDNVGYAGYAVLENCTVDGEFIGIRGEARNCDFRCKQFGVGHYYDYGAGAIFKDCSISATDYFEMYEGDFDSCEIFPSTPLSCQYPTNNISTSTFKKCKIFAVGTSVGVNDSRGSGGSFGYSLVFANSTNYGGYLVTPTAN